MPSFIALGLLCIKLVYFVVMESLGWGGGWLVGVISTAKIKLHQPEVGLGCG